MASPVLRLRSYTRIVASPPGAPFPAILIDDALDQRLKLDPTVLAVVNTLSEGVHSDDLASRAQLEPDLADRALELLDRMHVLDTEKAREFAADAAAIRELQLADPSAQPLLIRDDARFSCTMCGSCCGGHNIGPVSPDVLEGLEPHLDMLSEEIKSPKGLFFQLPVPRPDGGIQGQVLCHTSDGSCVFLDADRRCRIHAAVGGDKKPSVCRLFPYQFTATPDGIAVSLQMECRGMVEARRGKPLREQEEEIRTLLSLAPPARLRPVIAIDASHSMSWKTYQPLEGQLHDAVDTATGPADVMLAQRAVVLATLNGESRSTGTEATADTVGDQLDQFVAKTRAMLGTLHQQYSEADDTHVIHTDSLEVLDVGLECFTLRLEQIVSAPSSSEQRAIYRDYMHHALHGKVPTKSKRLTLGLARLNIGWFAAHAIAIARAHQVKRRHLVAQDLMDGLVITSFLLRNNDFLRAFSPLDTMVESLFFYNLGVLVPSAPRLAVYDPRLELTKF